MKKQATSKPLRYELRDEIEDIIKEVNIDRTEFHETAKNMYEKVQRNVYYAFCDYKKYPAVQVDTYMWTRFRKDLKSTDLIITRWDDWDDYIGKLDTLIPGKKNPMAFYYLVVDGGWVYEGTLTAIKKVLLEYPCSMADFYLFPKDYSWLITHCEDGASMCRVWKY
ncbi:MAG: hypothetical protein K2N73_12540 [Lachnospiraceae bacterium]|nr:hypothetical protein [Lachnospiraceae bacterium]